jgi:hypothetical protein
VLLRLLELAPAAACQGLAGRRHLPRPVQEAMLAHSSTEVRTALARHPHVLPDVRSLLLADPDWRVTVRAFGSPGQQPLSDEVLNSLLTRIEVDAPCPIELFTSAELFEELWVAMRYDRRLHRLAAAHPNPQVRRYAAAVPYLLDESSRAALTADPVPEIREIIIAALAEEQRVMRPADLPDRHCHALWAVLQRPLSRALVDQVVVGGDESALYFVGTNPSTPPDVVQALLRHPAPEIRRRIASRTDLSLEQVLQLAGDPAAEVRTAVSVHPALTERQRAGIDIDVAVVDGDGHYGSCRHAAADDGVTAIHDATRWARSVNPLLRRRAARNPHLPADLVTVLTDDVDLGVRVLLARHHPGASPELLLRCFLEYRRCGREQLTELAQFPTRRLAAFADHADPALRRLATRDPEADPALVERLCTDPDTSVRQAAAACPRLPANRIIALLDDPELAEHAAANPALPMTQMSQFLQNVLRPPS